MEIDNRVRKGHEYTISSYEQIVQSYPQFARDGYSISAWNTKRDGTGEVLSVGQTITISSDNLLYAQWYRIQDKDEDTIDHN